MTTAVLPASTSSVVVEPPTTKATTEQVDTSTTTVTVDTTADPINKAVSCDAAADDDNDDIISPVARSQNDPDAGAATRRAASAQLKRCHSTPGQKLERIAKKHKKRRRVSFESAEIYEFEPTIFTTSVTSGGIPVGMSSQERSRSRRRLDSWELEREDMRVGRQSYMEEGYLDPVERETILNNAGCAEHSMLSVEAEVNQIIAHRRESNEADFEFLYGLTSIGEDDDEDGDEADDVVEEEREEKKMKKRLKRCN